MTAVSNGYKLTVDATTDLKLKLAIDGQPAVLALDFKVVGKGKIK